MCTGQDERVEMRVSGMCCEWEVELDGLDIRRSMHDQSKRYQLDREGAAGAMCVYAVVESAAAGWRIKCCAVL